MANVVIRTKKLNRFNNHVFIEGHTVSFDHSGQAEVDGYLGRELIEKHDDILLVSGELPVDKAPATKSDTTEIGSQKDLNKCRRDELVTMVTEMYTKSGKTIDITDAMTKKILIEMISSGVQDTQEADAPITREMLEALSREELLALSVELETAKGVDETEFVEEQITEEIIAHILELTKDEDND